MGCRVQGRGMINLATSQVQIECFEWAYPNINPICDLLEFVKGLVLQIQSYRISINQGNNRITGSKPYKVPLSVV